MIKGNTPNRIWYDHFARYIFAQKYVVNMRVLDIACGSGYGSYALAETGSKRVVGVDIDYDTIKCANIEYERGNLEFINASLLSLPFPEEHFDIVVCFETIEHVKESTLAMKEITRVLTKNGMLIISSPNRRVTSPGKKIDDFPSNKHHVKEFTKNEFKSLVSNYMVLSSVWGQRGLSIVLFLPFLEKILRVFFRNLFSPDLGNSEVKRVVIHKIYRYIVLICTKD